MKSSPSIRHYVVSVKFTVKISSIFVAFLENTSFTQLNPLIQMGNNLRRPQYLKKKITIYHLKLLSNVKKNWDIFVAFGIYEL